MSEQPEQPNQAACLTDYGRESIGGRSIAQENSITLDMLCGNYRINYRMQFIKLGLAGGVSRLRIDRFG
jgi:hypothetical protein